MGARVENLGEGPGGVCDLLGGAGVEDPVGASEGGGEEGVRVGIVDVGQSPQNVADSLNRKIFANDRFGVGDDEVEEGRAGEGHLAQAVHYVGKVPELEGAEVRGEEAVDRAEAVSELERERGGGGEEQKRRRRAEEEKREEERSGEERRRLC